MEIINFFGIVLQYHRNVRGYCSTMPKNYINILFLNIRLFSLIHTVSHLSLHRWSLTNMPSFQSRHSTPQRPGGPASRSQFGSQMAELGGPRFPGFLWRLVELLGQRWKWVWCVGGGGGGGGERWCRERAWSLTRSLMSLSLLLKPHQE